MARPSARAARTLQRAALLLLTVTFVHCARSDPEREVRAAIAAMASAVEQRDPAELLSHLADDFTRESAAFGKAEARRMLTGLMLRNQTIRVATVIEQVQVDGERVTARLRLIATGGAGLLPERGQAWDVQTAWRRIDGRWQLYNADWRDVL